MEKYTVGQYLIDRLYSLGLKHLFSIAGDYSIDWINNYVEKSPIKIIEEVNEMNAGYAADGYARLNGIGALCVTYSAGALSAVNPIAGAYVEKVPVVLINGTPSIKRTLTFEQTGFSSHHFITGRETDLQSFEHITAAAIRIDNPDLAPMLIDYALMRCWSERQPVYIELLQDMVEQECEAPKKVLARARTMSDKDSLTISVTRIKEKLENATSPLIWVGPEVDRFGLHRSAKQLIDQLQIPYVTELLSKAVLSENDKLFGGVFVGKASAPEVQELVERCDFMLALGVWLTDINTIGWPIDLEKTAFVSWDTVKHGTFFNAQVSLDHFIDALNKVGVKPKQQELPRQITRKPPETDLDKKIDYQGFYNFVQQFIDEDTIIGSDASLNYFGTLLLKVGAQRGYIAQPSYSSIGYIGPAATGICLAKKDNQRVMVFSGDGGFQMSLQCLSTQTRFKLSPIIFVIDNGVFGVEQWLADAGVYHGRGNFYESCNVHPWNYSLLAKVIGCEGSRVGTYSELKTAMADAKKIDDRPFIIQVVVESTTIPDNAMWKEN